MFDHAKKVVGEKVTTQITHYLDKDPEKNIEKAVNLAAKLAMEKNHKDYISSMREYLLNPESNWHELYMKVMTETNPEVRDKVVVNFLINSVLMGIPKERELSRHLGYSVPWAILIDPTDRCNLHCKGCWAGKYAKKNDLDFALLDRIITEGEDLSIYFYVWSGGEPLVRREDIVKLALRHPDSVFHIFTNGTLIDDAFAEKCVKAGNITFALSVEGFEEATDARRGKGVFKKVMQAAEILKKHGLFFGFSTAYHRNNTEEVGSDEYIDMLVDKGFLYGWFFTYVPVGADEDLNFMATPEQRAYMYQRLHEIRDNKAIFTIDFWNDGQYSGGCIAGGRRYFHINAAGEVEPCAFIHYSNCNIKDVSLKEALGNPLFRAYQKRQPFDNNLLRPCPLIDCPHKLADCVQESGARSTQVVPVDADLLAHKMEHYADSWAKTSNQIWNTNMHP